MAATTASRFATDAAFGTERADATKPEDLPEEEEEDDKELEAADSLEGDRCTLKDPELCCCLGGCSSFVAAAVESSGPVAAVSPVTAGLSKWTQWNTSLAVLCVPTILM